MVVTRNQRTSRRVLALCFPPMSLLSSLKLDRPQVLAMCV